MGTKRNCKLAVIKRMDDIPKNNWYVSELSKYSPYSQSKIEELFEEYHKTGNKEIKDEIALHNGRLLIWVAKHWVNSGVPLEDLCQYGFMGLLHAIEKYKLEEGTKFSTWAVLWIKQSIQRNVINNESAVRLPVWLKNKSIKANEYIKHCKDELDYEPTDDEICEYLEILPEQYNLIKDYERNLADVLSSDSKYSALGCDDSVTLGNTFVDSHLCEQDALFNELSENIDNLMRVILSQREYEILCLRMGFNKARTHTLAECASIYGVSVERVRQLECKALKKLRRSGRVRQLKDYWKDM